MQLFFLITNSPIKQTRNRMVRKYLCEHKKKINFVRNFRAPMICFCRVVFH